MPQSRRRLFTMFIGIAGTFAVRPTILSAEPPQRTPQPIPSPNAPNQNFPPGLDGPDQRLPSNQKQVDPKKQEEIRSDIEKLYELVTQLRQQSQKADLNSTLPLTVVKTAQEIEKLAKRVKDLSKG